ncbi:MAG: transaminase [bacterium]|nr:transaminase [bacterium]
MKIKDVAALEEILAGERARFVETHPRSEAMFERSRASLLNGVPMNWMTKWATPFPLFAQDAEGCHVTDVDGHRYLDLCLGDTAAFFGHNPVPLTDALSQRAARGLAMMMPTEDAIHVGVALQRHFALKYWQIAMTATDANRFAIRLARAITGRHKVLVFNGGYHGSLVETLVELAGDAVEPNADSLGPECDPATTTRVVEYNDLEALEHALAHGDVACVLAEPALTNCGLVPPEEGFHDGLRELTRRYGSLLLIDETHTICTAPGGFTRAFGLEPDILTVGKSIGGGVPVAVFGFSEDTAARIDGVMESAGSGVYAVGGTLAGNALSLRALRVTLETLMTEDAFDRMIGVAERMELDVAASIARHRSPWYVRRLGACVAYGFRPTAPRNGGEALAQSDPLLESVLHLFFINRRVLLTPFQTMALVSPQTTLEDAARHARVFDLFAATVAA